MRAPLEDDVIVSGCRFPRDRLYDVSNHLWYAPLDQGLVRVGMTVVAVALASNRIFAFTPKRVGRPLEAGHSCATIESSKWVGPARIAFDGTVEAVNEALMRTPGLLVDDPYGSAWMLLARPADPRVLAALTPGSEVAAPYFRWMEDNDFPGCAEVPAD